MSSTPGWSGTRPTASIWSSAAPPRWPPSRRRCCCRACCAKDRRPKHAAATMPIAEYGQLDGLALGDLVRRREVTPAELIEEAIARAERVNPRIGAIVTPLYDRARAQAATAAAD